MASNPRRGCQAQPLPRNPVVVTGCAPGLGGQVETRRPTARKECVFLYVTDLPEFLCVTDLTGCTQGRRKLGFGGWGGRGSWFQACSQGIGLFLFQFGHLCPALHYFPDFLLSMARKQPTEIQLPPACLALDAFIFMHTCFRGKRVAPRLLLRVALLSPAREERAS